MRRRGRSLSFISLAAALAAATAVAPAHGEVAAALAPGTASLSLRGGEGEAQIGGRGALLGRLEQGRLIVVGPVGRPEPEVAVRGARLVKKVRGRITVYQGEDLSFRIFGGRWRIRLVGAGIEVSAVVRGWLRLHGDGTFSVAEGPDQAWPTEWQLVRVAPPTFALTG